MGGVMTKGLDWTCGRLECEVAWLVHGGLLVLIVRELKNRSSLKPANVFFRVMICSLLSTRSIPIGSMRQKQICSESRVV